MFFHVLPCCFLVFALVVAFFAKRSLFFVVSAFLLGFLGVLLFNKIVYVEFCCFIFCFKEYVCVQSGIIPV